MEELYDVGAGNARHRPSLRFCVNILSALVAFASFFSSPAQAAGCYVVGTWNLEHFGFGKSRGFPEMSGQIDERTPEQLDGIASAIRDTLQAKILVLNEINGRAGAASSAELDDLIARLGATWAHRIAASGESQRNAIIWDTRFVEEIAHKEIFVGRKLVEGKDIFERDPLAVFFRFLEDEEPRNDLLVVALHLASGQENEKNHDAAMLRLRGELRTLRGNDPILPNSEDDILLAGDLNASPFEPPTEEFFKSFNRGNWKLLAAGPTYPATRVNGSQIDYIIVTRTNSRQVGLWNEEISVPVAIVEQALAEGDMVQYRRDFSDHFPVTTCVDVVDDSD